MTDFPGDPFAAPVASRPELIRNGRYHLPPLDNPTGKTIARTRVTNFVKAVSDTYALGQWQLRELAIGFALREDLYDLLRSTDLTDRDAVQAIASRALEAAKSGRVGRAHGHGGNETGTALHAHTDQVDRGQPVTARKVWAPKLVNYQAAMAEAHLEVMPDMIECRVVIERFGLAGTFDRVLTFESWPESINFIGDLKTQKMFYTWWEIAMQLALYAHADAMWDMIECRYRDMPTVSQDIAIVAHMPMIHKGDDPDRVQLYQVDIAEGWKACQLVGDVRTLRTAGKHWGRPLEALSGSLSAIEAYAARLRDAESRDDLTLLFDGMKVYFRGTLPGELSELGSIRWAALQPDITNNSNNTENVT